MASEYRPTWISKTYRTGRHLALVARANLAPIALLLAGTQFLGTATIAATTASRANDTCQRAAHYAAAKTGIPVSILLAISLTETGRKKNGAFEPWPWTVNMEGKGVWFKTRKAAFDYAIRHFDRGARSFDVGCFQINYKWHGKAFNSIEEMFDPKINAVYAAKYLLALFDEKGSWEGAAGAYHSRTPKYANKYKKRFSSIHARLNNGKGLPTTGQTKYRHAKSGPRINRYPLLQPQSDGVSSNGSLVSLGAKRSGTSLITLSAGRLF